jgi:hypothetical protein
MILAWRRYCHGRMVTAHNSFFMVKLFEFIWAAKLSCGYHDDLVHFFLQKVRNVEVEEGKMKLMEFIQRQPVDNSFDAHIWRSCVDSSRDGL